MVDSQSVNEFLNEYFMKFCDEFSTKNCKEKQCQYRIFCSRYKHLHIKEHTK